MWDQYLRSGPEFTPGNMLTVRALKLYMDGALGSRGAALFEPYSDDPGNRGLTVTSETDLEAACRQALAHGFQVCVHAIGDRGNDIVLNVYENVLASGAPGEPSPRWRIEHAQVVSLPDIQRFAKIGVIPSMQPTHATSDMPWAETRVGPERIKGAYAWRRFLQSGCMIVGGSDFPVESNNPLWGFYAAITRTDREGNPPGGWYPDQIMTREEAARAYTQWAAYGGFQEDWKGTIEPGKTADLTVFGEDIMKIEPKDILTTPVEMTIVAGRVAYRKPAAP
jgi:predicted amidohydrolase YtcJ